MSASADRRTKREIRRAFGPVAIDLVGQQAKAIRDVANALQVHREAYAVREKIVGAEREALFRRVSALEEWRTEPRGLARVWSWLRRA